MAKSTRVLRSSMLAFIVSVDALVTVLAVKAGELSFPLGMLELGLVRIVSAILTTVWTGNAGLRRANLRFALISLPSVIFLVWWFVARKTHASSGGLLAVSVCLSLVTGMAIGSLPPTRGAARGP
jgi:hypothetical protein